MISFRLFVFLCSLVIGSPSFASSAPAPRLVCVREAPSLASILSAFDRRVGVRTQQAQVRQLVRRARHAAWLPQLVLSAEHRDRQDEAQDTELAAALRLHARDEQVLVLRARMRWNLDRLVHHHSSLAALRFAQRVGREHRAARQQLAVTYAQWKGLQAQGCRSGWTRVQYEELLRLRAMVIADTGLALPEPGPWRVKVPSIAPSQP